jgi:hypothetical protein
MAGQLRQRCRRLAEIHASAEQEYTAKADSAEGQLKDLAERVAAERANPTGASHRNSRKMVALEGQVAALREEAADQARLKREYLSRRW